MLQPLGPKCSVFNDSQGVVGLSPLTELKVFWGLKELKSKQESDALSFRTRLALIRPAVQLPVQNLKVKSRFREGEEGETVCVQEENQVYITNFSKQGK